MKKNRIHDVAKYAGVSTSTVSRVFNNRPYVREEIKDKVMEAAIALDYTPKSITCRDTISLVLSSNMPSGPYEEQICSQIISAAMSHGLSVDFVSLRNIDRVYQNFSKAIIGIVSHDFQVEILKKIRNIPVLLVNNFAQGCNHICTDHYGGIFQAADYLLNHGHKIITLAMCSTKEQIESVNGDKERVRGFKEALEKHQCSFSDDMICYNAYAENIITYLETKHPTAIIAGGEHLTMPIHYAISKLGWKIPQDISVIWLYTSTISPFLYPAPTCINQNFEDFAKLTVEKAIALMVEDVSSVELVLNNTFMKGDSVLTLN